MRRSELISLISTVLLFLALEILSIMMASNNSIVQRYRIMGAIRNTQTSMWKTSRKVQYFINYRVENEKLAQENLALRQELDLYKTAADAVDSVSSKAGYTYILARVVKNSTNKQHNFIVLNRGRNDGIETGMGVITDNGVVGVVNAVQDDYSQVISFLSADQRVSAKIAGNGTFGPLAWKGRSVRQARMTEIPEHTEVNPGDTILTSGFSTIYPPDIPLGKVTKVFDNGVSIDINVELFQNFGALQHVYVVANNNAGQIKQLEK
ncbi:MAG: rod shape-determining protein MreC [Bacteroidales bacterium]|nr:rod shape-determining protein MreC [Bacteroidales bacterium]